MLTNQESNVDGDQALTFTLPPGFGDCALMECSASVATIATVVANPELLGVTFQLTSPEDVPQDIVFNGRWVKRRVDQLSVWAAPDQVQFWREHEELKMLFAEIDTNATPTADVVVYIKVKRLRPLLTMGPREFHLVEPIPRYAPD